MNITRLTIRKVIRGVGGLAASGLVAASVCTLGVRMAHATLAVPAVSMASVTRALPPVLTGAAGSLAVMQEQHSGSAGGEVMAAAEGIRAATARHLAALAVDSLKDRATPGPAQEAAARYVADQLQRFGLHPLGDVANDTARSWFQRYPVPGQLHLNHATSTLWLKHALQSGMRVVADEDGRPLRRDVAVDFSSHARFVPEAGTPLLDPGRIGDFGPEPTPHPLVLLSGPQTAASIATAQLADHVVLYLPPMGMDSAAEQMTLQQLYAASQGVLLLRASDDRTTDDSARFAARLQTALQRSIPLVDFSLRKAVPGVHWSWVIELRPGMLDAWLAAAGVDVAAARAATAPQVRDLGTQLWIEAFAEPLANPRTAPNVIGLIEGTDPTLKHEYLIVATPLDGAGIGAADNTAGLPVLLAVAEALRQPGAAPRRSVIILATSAAAAGSWGSTYFADRVAGRYSHSVADLTLRLSGRAGSGPTVTVDGGADVEFGQSLAWLLAAHPELGMTLHEGATAVAPTGEHFPLVQAGLPSLYLHDQPGAASPTVEVAPTAQIGRFAFYLAEALANAPTVRWTPAGRRRFAEVMAP